MANFYKDFKYYHILNLIAHFGPISRTELTSLTDYRSGTVGDIVKEMEDLGIVVEAGRLSVGHGRSRSLIQINNKLCALGVGITNTKLIVTLEQSDGETLGQRILKIAENDSHETIIDKAVAFCSELLKQFPENRLIGIGIALPSYNPAIRNSETLEINYLHYNDWITGTLVRKLEEAFHLPIQTYSAVGLPAEAESLFGAAKGCQNFICVELSNGIGSSIFCNGKVMSGSANIAGQLGHTVVNRNKINVSHICTCGKPGCVESEASWPAIRKQILEALESYANSSIFTVYNEKGDIRATDVCKCLNEGDKLCRFIVKEAARNIGIAVANEINVLNPEKVIFHGFMMELGPYFLEQLKDSIHDNVLSLSQNFEIFVSESLENIMPRGAAAKMFSSFYRSNDYQWVYELDPAIILEKLPETV